jgi:hypothetical protein
MRVFELTWKYLYILKGISANKNGKNACIKLTNDKHNKVIPAQSPNFKCSK